MGSAASDAAASTLAAMARRATLITVPGATSSQAQVVVQAVMVP